ncbi:uncharacterized protein V6R79_023852 [Siganus canaliculatus]
MVMERMKLLLICRLVFFLHVASCSGASSDAAVIQSPDVTVSEGDTVELSCCWTVEYETITVQWLKNKTIVKSKRFEINDTMEQLTEGKADCWNLNLTAVTEQDAGTYICKVTVDIPSYVTAEGSGTVITVMVKERPKDSIDPPAAEPHETEEYRSEEVLVQALRYLPILALLLSFLYLNQWVTKARQTASDSSEKDLPSGQRQEEDAEEEEEEEEEGREEREGEAEPASGGEEETRGRPVSLNATSHVWDQCSGTQQTVRQTNSDTALHSK